MKKLVLIISFLLIVQLLFGGILSVKEVYKLEKKGEIVIVSARNSSDYSTKHIKGAVNIYHKDLYKSEGTEAMLKGADEIAEVFGENGITSDTKIAIYDNGDNKLAGRLYWIFEYLGADDVNILNGHVKSWMKGRKPITRKKTEITPTTFQAEPDASKLATMDYVKNHLNDDNIILLDVRSAEEYNGEEENEEVNRPGHIPGAILFEYKKVINDDGTLKTKEEIASALSDSGIDSSKEIILYCATSVRAGIVYAALTSIMEIPNVRVFDGAYYQWDSDETNPIE